MTEDLLSRIQRETHERLRELRGAVDEHERLQGELRALDASEPSPDTAPPANVVRLPARPRLPRARMVSPKVARLMRAPRRPALERAGVVRVGTGRVGSSSAGNLWPQEAGEEVDAEAELFEDSL